jgi:hypothetical protein
MTQEVESTIDGSSPGVYLISWKGLGANQTGAWKHSYLAEHLSAQVSGDFGAGAKVTFEGSNKNPPGASTIKEDGSPLAFFDEGIRRIKTRMFWIRPIVTGGDPSTKLDVDLFLAHRLR